MTSGLSVANHSHKLAEAMIIADVPMGKRPDHAIGLMSAWFTPEPT